MSTIVDVVDCVKSLFTSDPERKCSAKAWRKATTGAAYMSFCLFVNIAMALFTSGDFSVLLTLSAVTQCMGFVMLNIKVNFQRTVEGLSTRMLEMYALVVILRLISTLCKNGYIPNGITSDYFYQIVDTSTLLLVLNLIYSVRVRYVETYQREHDTLPIYKATPAVMLLAFYVHANLDHSVFFDTFFMASLLVDSIAMLPQLFMLSKLGGQVESLNAHFVAAMAVSRGFSFFFWYYGYKEMAPKDGSPNIAGYLIIIAHVFQFLLCADFLYYYLLGLYRERNGGMHGTFLPSTGS